MGFPNEQHHTIIIDFITKIENRFQHNVKVIHSHNGNKFLIKHFFPSKKIIHQTTCIETREQNKIVER